MFLLIPSSSVSKVLVAVSMFSMMNFPSNLRFSARCETVVATPVFSQEVWFPSPSEHPHKYAQ